jgi:hypothetical protein
VPDLLPFYWRSKLFVQPPESKIKTTSKLRKFCTLKFLSLVLFGGFCRHVAVEWIAMDRGASVFYVHEFRRFITSTDLPNVSLIHSLVEPKGRGVNAMITNFGHCD